MPKAMLRETDANGKPVRYFDFSLEQKRALALAMVEDMILREDKSSRNCIPSYCDRMERLWTNRVIVDE